MAEIEIRLPKMGESVTEATITNWLKNPGENVSLDEPLVEVATDKVDNELPSEAEGILVKQLFDRDQVAQVGDVIAIISTDSDPDITNNDEGIQEKTIETPEASIQEEVATTLLDTPVSSNGNGSLKISKNGSNGKYYSPLVRSIAEKEGVSQETLDNMSGSGLDGRVTKKDILNYIKGDSSVSKSVPEPQLPKSAPVVESKPAPIVIPNGEDEIIEMDRMRKLIADHMVMSKQVSPHVTSFVEADVTNIFEWRNKIKGPYKQREGENMTFTPILIEAIVKAIKDFPMVNVSVSGNQIIKKRNINIGMVTALPSGNLIVPVIKNADRLSLSGLTKSVNELANKARDNKLKPEDIKTEHIP